MSGFWLLPHFQRPAWLWALLALPLLWLLWRRGRRDGWREAVDAHLLPHLVEPGNGRAGWRMAGIGLAYVLAVLALSGPGWRLDAQPRWQAHDPLVIALELSGAMAAQDLPPSRLVQARAKLARLLALREGGELGLVAWAEDAFTVAPLTADAGNLALFLDALEPEVMPVDGQRSERALTHAASLLRQAGFANGTILLVATHADAASPGIAAALAAQGYTVSVLGVGTAAGAPYRDRGGAIRGSRLDVAGLRALAAAGGGRYATLAVDDSDLEVLGVLQPDIQRGRPGAAGARIWLDQGYWLLLPLLLLAALAFRRGAGVLAALPLALLLVPLESAASGHRDGWWLRADQQAQRRLEEGVEAYRQGDFAAAGRAFDAAGARGAVAAYNLGNALARQGRYDEAIAAYDQALAQAPGMEDAIANRRVVEAARQRQRERNGHDGDGQASPGRDRQGQDGPGERAGDSPPRRGQGDDGSSAAPDAPGGGSGQSPPQAADEEVRSRQDAADRALRARMQRALEDGDADQPPPELDPRDARDRERHQAHEAWLRRVPDDPGGLLRAKFQLEHERRQREGR